MNNFVLNFKTKIFFGKNQIRSLAKEIKKYGNNILLIYGEKSLKENGIYKLITDELNVKRINLIEFSGVKPNPKLNQLRECIDFVKNYKVNLILAAGGGSVIDFAKAVACGYYYDGDIWDFFYKRKKVEKALPLGTILTNSASGSEMNGNSIITNEETKEKLGLHSKEIIPKFSILDPTFTFSVSPLQTAIGISDIMSHLMEQYFSPSENCFINDGIIEILLKTCIKFGKIAYIENSNYEARANIMWAATLALNGLVASGKMTDWASHIIAHKLSAYYDITHGVSMAIIFPAWLKYVYCKENEWKFINFSKNIFDLNDSYLGIEKLVEFYKDLNLPVSLKEINISSAEFDKIAKEIIDLHGVIGCFKKLEYHDIINILNIAMNG